MLLVAGDLFSELARPDGLRETIRHWQEVFREFLEGGGTILTLTGNHDNENFCQTLGERDVARRADTSGTRRNGSAGPAVPGRRSDLRATRRPLGGFPVQFVLMPYPTPHRFLNGEGGLKYGSPEEKNKLLVAAWADALRDIRAHPKLRPEGARGSRRARPRSRVEHRPEPVPPHRAKKTSSSRARTCRSSSTTSALGHIHKPQWLGCDARALLRQHRADGPGRAGRPEGRRDLRDRAGRADRRTGRAAAAGDADLRSRGAATRASTSRGCKLEYPDAKNDLVNLHIRYTAGKDQLEDVLRDLDRIFPRWYARDWKETGALGPTLVNPAAGSGEGLRRNGPRLPRARADPARRSARRDAILKIADGAAEGYGAGDDPATRQAVRLPVVQGRAGDPLRRVAAVDALRAPTAAASRASSTRSRTRCSATTAAAARAPRNSSTRSRTRSPSSSTSRVEKQLYRIKRTVRRQKNGKIASTQQVLKFTPSEIADDAWEAVSGTEYKAKFDAWVKDKIGLDYETFTSSVLLLQGKSEKLLDSTPAGRAGVLARIVDLERYQKLHGKADDKRRALKSELEWHHQPTERREGSDRGRVRGGRRAHRGRGGGADTDPGAHRRTRTHWSCRPAAGRTRSRSSLVCG